MAGVGAPVVSGATSTAGQFTATIPLAVASITINPDTGTFGSCTGDDATALTLPDGTCTTNVDFVESGSAADIDASSTAATPSDGGAE
jgi:hypothetical protein